VQAVHIGAEAEAQRTGRLDTPYRLYELYEPAHTALPPPPPRVPLGRRAGTGLLKAMTRMAQRGKSVSRSMAECTRRAAIAEGRPCVSRGGNVAACITSLGVSRGGLASVCSVAVLLRYVERRPCFGVLRGGLEAAGGALEAASMQLCPGGHAYARGTSPGGHVTHGGRLQGGMLTHGGRLQGYYYYQW
jgi:hypothetical protein